MNQIEINFFGSSKNNFLGTSKIFDKESEDKLSSYLDLKKTFKKLSKKEEVDDNFIPSLHLPQPKDNQYWKSDLDHKLRCLLRVDQNDYDSEAET